MNITLQLPKLMHLRPRITVVGVGGAGSNAVNNMIASGLGGVNFVVANTDAQSLANSNAEHRLQLGAALTEGLGAGAKPEIGRAAAEETIEEIRAQVAGSHMVFVAAGMGGGTGTGAAAVIARVARECGALTVGVVTKPFHFEGTRRMRAAEAGIALLKPEVDTLIVIPNQNLFRIANERTTFADAFVLADQVLYSGIACVVDLIVKEGLINLDFADVRTIMSGMGTAMMGTGEASGERRAVLAAEEAISNPLLDDISLRGARGLLVSITGNRDLTLYEVDEAATRVRQEVDGEANIIVGATFDDTIGDRIRVSIVASGMERIGDTDAVAPGVGIPVGVEPVPAIGMQPSMPDTQPPFIEPYPAPYPQAPISFQPFQEQQPRPSHAEHLQMHVRGHAATQQGLPDADLTRALSDALNGRAAPEAGYVPQPAGGWASPNGAVFEDAPPHLAAPIPLPHPPLAQLGPDRAGYEPAFSPQQPADTRRLTRRMPEMDEFPVVGQREYRAKMGHYAEPPPQPPPRAYAHPATEPPRKLGFFERLTGVRRKPAPAAPESSGYQQASNGAGGSRGQPISNSRSAAADGPRGAPARVDDPHDLPVFFGTDRK